MAKKRVVVICPGRGSYTKETLGYLKPHRDLLADFLNDLDARRQEIGEPKVTELDQMGTFRTSLHTKGEHASVLIYACAMADYVSLDPDKYEVVAVTGNSMGWYLTLAMAGSLNWQGAFEVIQTMGSMMKEKIIGGQIIYPVVDENWQISTTRVSEIQKILRDINLDPESEAYISIYLGGYWVLAGNEKGLEQLQKRLPQVENYPFRLINHAAFHTPLLRPTSEKAMRTIRREIFSRPQIPMIDGRGKIWMPYSTDCDELYDYTLGHQVYEPYDFTAAVSVALKEFAPDHLILLGPGNSLGGTIGQILVQNRWYDLDSKAAFSTRQKTSPILISMGLKS